MHELVLRVANADLSHPSYEWMTGIAENRSIVEVLAYRHFQLPGGLVLPPRDNALGAIMAHGEGLEAAYQDLGSYPKIAFPNWREMMGKSAPTPPSAGKKLPGDPFTPVKSKVRGGPGHGRMGGANPFGAPGDGCGPPRGAVVAVFVLECEVVVYENMVSGMI